MSDTTSENKVSVDIGVLLQTIWDLGQEIRSKEDELSQAKSMLENLYSSGVLDEQDWLDDDRRIGCVEFTASRQVRTNWTYPQAVEELRLAAKAAEKTAQKDGTAVATPGTVSWVFRAAKKEEV